MVKKGSLLIFLAATLWGIAGIFVKKLSGFGISAMPIVVFRCAFTALIIGAFMLFKNPKGFKIRLGDIHLFAMNGIFSIVMFTFCYYKTMQLSTLSVAAILLYTAPIFVMIISALFFGEKLGVKKILALIIAFAGCTFVSGIIGSDVKISYGAVIYGLLTGFGYALYTIIGNRLILKGYNTATIIFYTFAFALAGSSVITVLNHEAAQLKFNQSVLIWAILMALLNAVIPYVLYTAGLKYVSASVAPIIATVEPVAATVVGLFYGERLTVYGVIGIILVLLSVVILNVKSGEKVDNKG